MAGVCSRSVTTWVRKTRGAGVAVMHEVAKETYKEVKTRSPVLTGRYRGSWRISTGGVKFDSQPKDDPGNARGARTGSPLTAAEKADLEKVLPRVKWRDIVSISNFVRNDIS